MKFAGLEIVGEIGRGGMGVVYRARDPSNGRDYAIKLLAKRDAASLERFKREARLQASLFSQEGFVPLQGSGVENGVAYMVMSFVAGGALRAKLSRGPFSIDETWRLARLLARALAAAHERGIVHRDLKPENILFDGESPLIADLGLAKHFASDAPGASQSVSLSHTGELRGTAGYMAPEQMRDARSVGPEADVFALGAILHECLTGVPVFAGASLIQVVTRVESGPAAPIATLRPETPAALARAIDRALSPIPAARFRDAGALLEALEAAEPSERRVPAVFAVALVAIALVAVGAFAAVAWAGRGAPRPSPSPATTPAIARTPARPPITWLGVEHALHAWALRLSGTPLPDVGEKDLARVRASERSVVSAVAGIAPGRIAASLAERLRETARFELAEEGAPAGFEVRASLGEDGLELTLVVPGSPSPIATARVARAELGRVEPPGGSWPALPPDEAVARAGAAFADELTPAIARSGVVQIVRCEASDLLSRVPGAPLDAFAKAVRERLRERADMRAIPWRELGGTQGMPRGPRPLVVVEGSFEPSADGARLELRLTVRRWGESERVYEKSVVFDGAR